jgi:hypothetical protein
VSPEPSLQPTTFADWLSSFEAKLAEGRCQADQLRIFLGDVVCEDEDVSAVLLWRLRLGLDGPAGDPKGFTAAWRAERAWRADGSTRAADTSAAARGARDWRVIEPWSVWQSRSGEGWRAEIRPGSCSGPGPR